MERTIESYIVAKLEMLEGEVEGLKAEKEELEERVNEAEDEAAVRYEIIKALVEMFGIAPTTDCWSIIGDRYIPEDYSKAARLREALERLGVLKAKDSGTEEQ